MEEQEHAERKSGRDKERKRTAVGKKGKEKKEKGNI
jgi:hypothetical protein